jgi:hypothetical protein
VLAQQFLRTSAGRTFAAVSTRMSRHIVDSLYKTGLGKKAIERLASAIFKKALHGAAAKNVVSKIFRTNAVTAAATTVALTIPDFYKALESRSISWAQFSKNFAVNVAGIGGGAAGAVIGAAAGSWIPVVGNVVGGLVGGLAGGVGSALGVKKIADLIVEDDAKKMVDVMNEVVSELAFDYLVTEVEFEQQITPQISQIVTPKWLTAMFKSGSTREIPLTARQNFAQESLEPLFIAVAAHREPISLPAVRLVKKEVGRVKRKLFWAYVITKFNGLVFGKSQKDKVDLLEMGSLGEQVG